MRKLIYEFMECELLKAISSDYVRDIVDNIVDDVVIDVEECADLDSWNYDDVKLAIGRVLKSRLGIE